MEECAGTGDFLSDRRSPKADFDPYEGPAALGVAEALGDRNQSGRVLDHGEFSHHY